ncbi:myosin-2-like isoform X1 [Canna indica]|uniref:Myosin-2-like isoform X1 n=1 Tax=Canna indica TaxID=4628 RepID=A0AAQ3KWU3_9LILI|nr:myosin-2-like isoform X1 [Canna indica]
MAYTLSVTTTAARSVLEEMLEAIKLRDERPEDVPPDLPLRPTLRGRLRSSRSPVSTKFKIGDSASGYPAKDPNVEEMARSDLSELDKGFAVKDQSAKLNFADAEESEYYEETPGKPVASQLSSADAVDENIGYNGHTGYAKKASSKDQSTLHASGLEDLEKLVAKMKAELGEKEKENAALFQQVKEYEKKWSVCEEKMKTMDEMYQKQIENLKMNIVGIQKSLVPDETVKPPETAESLAPEETRTKHPISEDRLSKDADDKHNVASHLTKEFDQKKQVFEEDVRVLSEVKPGQSALTAKSIEELCNLKVHYVAWKKEFRTQLRDTGASLKKLEKLKGDKPYKRSWLMQCWGMK